MTILETVTNNRATMRSSATTGQLAEAVAKAQAEYRPAIKDRKNPFFKSSYATLAEILATVRPPLSKYGVMISQGPPEIEGGSWGDLSVVAITTRLTHAQSGEWIESTTYMQAKDSTPQGIGSAKTYARRYGLMEMTGVAPEDEDDDGEAAQGRGVSGKQDFTPVEGGAAKMLRVGMIVKRIKQKFPNPSEFKGFVVEISGKNSVSDCTAEELDKLEKALADN